LLVAPNMLRQTLLEKIERETALVGSGERGHIQWKLNALEDVDIVRALYRAAQRGVTIDLIVRDTCRLRPGLDGVSSSVKVVSVIGRFLEHGRIYYFHNGGRPEYYIGSADAMPRNLEKRVEGLVPIEDARLQAELRHILDTPLTDQRGAGGMMPHGSYPHRTGLGAQHTHQQAAQ